ncbi:Protein kinase alk2 [Quaeritorhiza haematococci]|nr:Protein kinase alk2 [Quaeritorhiza haematococci]
MITSAAAAAAADPVVLGVTLFVIAVVGVLFYYRNHAVGSFAVPSGKKMDGFIPVLGHTVTILKNYDRLLHFIEEQMKATDYRPRNFSLAFSQPYAMICDPANLEYVLKTNFSNYEKGPFFYSRMNDLLGVGIFNTDGESWRIQRKTAANIFNVKNFREFVGVVFYEEMHMLTDRLSKAVESKEAIDIQDLFFRFTLDGFGKIGFGIELNSMLTKDSVPFAAAFDRAQAAMDYRFFSPVWRLEELLLPRGRELKNDLKTVREFCSKVIGERRADPEKNTRNDLLSLFMNLKNEDGTPMYTDKELGDLTLNFIIAGRDTTAQALSWTIYELALHPEKTKKLVEEIDETFGGDLNTPISYEQIKTMKYANAVFHEALRLHPSVPKDTKTALKDDVLPDGTPIKARTNLAWSPWVMGRSPKIWGPDAAEFKPERWLPDAMPSQPSQFVYPVFNAGPRVCLGKTMAELEGVFVLVSLLRRFEFEVLDVEKVTYLVSLTLPIRDKLMVKVSQRSK